MRRSGFTLTELVVTLIVITLVMTVALPITKKKLDKVDKYGYYRAYEVAKDISNTLKVSAQGASLREAIVRGDPTGYDAVTCAKNLYDCTVNYTDSDGNSQNQPFSNVPYEYCNASSPNLLAKIDCIDPATCTPQITAGPTLVGSVADYINDGGDLSEYGIGVSSCDYPDASYGLCRKIKEFYNVVSTNCTDSGVETAAPAGNFKNISNPQIVLDNGMIIHILSDSPAVIDSMKQDLSETQKTIKNSGFTIYVDVNGNAGKSKLYEDVFPFYLMLNGRVVPAFPSNSVSGGNDKDMLNFTVLYDDLSGGSRTVKALASGVSYQEAACLSGIITSSIYCKDQKTGARIQRDRSKCSQNTDCRIIKNKPFVMFGQIK